MGCVHKEIRYFELKKKAVCLDCGEEFYNLSVKIDHREKILTMKERGYTFEEIGKHLGLTKQRVHQIYKDMQENK